MHLQPPANDQADLYGIALVETGFLDNIPQTYWHMPVGKLGYLVSPNAESVIACVDEYLADAIERFMEIWAPADEVVVLSAAEVKAAHDRLIDRAWVEINGREDA